MSLNSFKIGCNLVSLSAIACPHSPHECTSTSCESCWWVIALNCMSVWSFLVAQLLIVFGVDGRVMGVLGWVCCGSAST